MQKLIKVIDNHYVIVDDSEIKEGDWYLNTFVTKREQKPQKHSKKKYLVNHKKDYRFKYCKKITHSTQKLEKQDISKNPTTIVINEAMKFVTKDVKAPKVVRDGLVKPPYQIIPLSEVEELINGYSVEKMANESFENMGYHSTVTSYEEDQFKLGYKLGFKAHQELTKDKLITEINKQISDFNYDLKESTSNHVKQNCEGAIFGLNKLKQSLLPKTEWNITFDKQGKIKLV